MASHQRRPDTFKATTAQGIFLIDSIRPVTHAVVCTTRDLRRQFVQGYVGKDAADKAAARRDRLDWDTVEVVELMAPATTGGRPEMTAEEFHLSREIAAMTDSELHWAEVHSHTRFDRDYSATRRYQALLQREQDRRFAKGLRTGTVDPMRDRLRAADHLGDLYEGMGE